LHFTLLRNTIQSTRRIYLQKEIPASLLPGALLGPRTQKSTLEFSH